MNSGDDSTSSGGVQTRAQAQANMDTAIALKDECDSLCSILDSLINTGSDYVSAKKAYNDVEDKFRAANECPKQVDQPGLVDSPLAKPFVQLSTRIFALRYR